MRNEWFGRVLHFPQSVQSVHVAVRTIFKQKFNLHWILKAIFYPTRAINYTSASYCFFYVFLARPGQARRQWRSRWWFCCIACNAQIKNRIKTSRSFHSMVSVSVVYWGEARAKPKQNNIIRSDKHFCCCQFECKWTNFNAHFLPKNGHGIEWGRCPRHGCRSTFATFSCYVSIEHVLPHLSWFYGFNLVFWSRAASAINCSNFSARFRRLYINI